MESSSGRPGGPDPGDVGGERPVALKRGRTTQEMLAEQRGPGFATTLLRTLLGLLAVIALLAVIYFGASALEGDTSGEQAPWASKLAPDVPPAPLLAQ